MRFIPFAFMKIDSNPVLPTTFLFVDLTLIPGSSTGINTFNVYFNGVLQQSVTVTGDTYNGGNSFNMRFAPPDNTLVKCEQVTNYTQKSFMRLGAGFDKRCCRTIGVGNPQILCDTWVNNVSKFTGGANGFSVQCENQLCTTSLNCTTC
jgi:hypothetical protein